MPMPLWCFFSGQPGQASLSSLGEAASLKSCLLFSSESLMRALFLKWSLWPQSPFWCLISPTLHTPCVCFKSLPPPAPQWGFRDYTTALLSTVLLFWEEVIAYSARLVPFSSFLMGFLVAGETGCLLSGLHCFTVWFATHHALMFSKQIGAFFMQNICEWKVNATLHCLVHAWNDASESIMSSPPCMR